MLTILIEFTNPREGLVCIRPSLLDKDRFDKCPVETHSIFPIQNWPLFDVRMIA